MRNLLGSTRVAVVCLVLASGGLVGCTSGGAQPSDFCKSLATINSTVSQINTDPMTKDTVPAVKASMGQIDQAAANLSSTAPSEFSSEVDAVTSATKQLDSSVDAVVKKQSPANKTAARADLKSLTNATKDLTDKASSTC